MPGGWWGGWLGICEGCRRHWACERGGMVEVVVGETWDGGSNWSEWPGWLDGIVQGWANRVDCAGLRGCVCIAVALG